MLSRASARSLRRPPSISTRSNQLIRPSQRLCQSCSAICRTISTSSSTPIKPRKPRSRDPSPSPRQSRNISSSLDSVTNTSFDPLLLLGSFGRQNQAVIQNIDPIFTRNESGVLVIPPSRLGILNSRQNFSHTLTELLQTINACASVGKFDRAKEIIRRMLETPTLTLGDVQEANVTFIRGMVHFARVRSSREAMSRLQKWYELDMRLMGLPPCSSSIALLCQAAFMLDNVKARSRTLRRYLGKAEEMGILTDTLSSPELDPLEFEELCRVREDLFTLPQVETENEDIVNAEPADLEQHSDEMSIKPTKQEGLGLSTLLSSIRSLETVPGNEKVSEKLLRDRQLELETHVYESEAKRWQAEHQSLIKLGINPALSGKSTLANLWEWKTALENNVKEHIEHLQAGYTSAYLDSLSLVYFEALSLETLASITIMNVMSIFSKTTEPVSVSVLVNSIGTQLADEHFAKTNMRAEGPSSRWKIRAKRRTMLRRIATGQKPLAVSENQPLETAGIRNDLSLEWPDQAKAIVAGFLLTKLVEVAKLPITSTKANGSSTEIVPAMTHSLIWERGKQKGVITPHAALNEKLSGKVEFTLDHYLPMISPPRPWVKSRGAYFRRPASLMRTTDKYGLQSMYLEAALSNGDADMVLKALSILSSTPWIINSDLLKVMVEVWNTGEPLTNFPPAEPNLEYPVKPDASAISKDKRDYHMRVRQLNNLKSGYKSNRCFINMQMELARAFRNIPLYFPHNIDFRGRAYPVPAILNHMGADHVRALCVFEKTKELGEHGLFWLKVHTANKFGINKASLEERVKFVDDHVEDIKDSAKNPLDGNRWWMTAEDPWQMLAACFELVGAWESPDPKHYHSRIPVQQDGSCNGLQHYAALGGDCLGAAQVNLVPSDRPADIYSRIGELVSAEVDKDAANDHEIAKRLQGKIVRKIVKRPVMTNVYGVTLYGVIRQVKSELDEIFSIADEAGKDNFQLALYISTKIFLVFGNIFAGATKIQDWLAECASIIATSLSQEQVEALSNEKIDAALKRGRIHSTAGRKKKKTSKTNNFQGAVVWTTPLGLPIAQPYRSTISKPIKMASQSLKFNQPDPTLSVSRRKQKSAFPPNFVHSLDATHMMMTVIECNRQGLEFASVHDSFWTHAADIPTMNHILREQFVKMHSEDIIKRLAEEFKTRHSGSFRLLSIPTKCAFYKKVQEHRKLNKPEEKLTSEGRKLHELKMESDRIKFLRSENADERKKGEEMVTLASLYRALGPDSADLKVPDEELELSATKEPEGSETKKKTTGKRMATTQIWIPIEFPPVPERGDFDIDMVLESKYFFS